MKGLDLSCTARVVAMLVVVEAEEWGWRSYFILYSQQHRYYFSILGLWKDHWAKMDSAHLAEELL